MDLKLEYVRQKRTERVNSGGGMRNDATKSTGSPGVRTKIRCARRRN
jgi:hypothetical protein